MKSGFLERLAAQVVSPPKGIPTCVTARGASQIDYSALAPCLAKARGQNKVVSTSPLATHRPRRLVSPKAAKDALHLIQQKPPAIPTKRPHGPIWSTQTFDGSTA